MPMNPYREGRKSTRLKNYDYQQTGYYFVTLVTHQRAYLFGEVVEGAVQLNELGAAVEGCWRDLPTHYPNVALDECVIMPNHVHGLLELKAVAQSSHGLLEIVRGFKTYSARRINRLRDTAGFTVWQRSFHDRIVRDENELNAIRQYIRNNPAQWENDVERRDTP